MVRTFNKPTKCGGNVTHRLRLGGALELRRQRLSVTDGKGCSWCMTRTRASQLMCGWCKPGAKLL